MRKINVGLFMTLDGVVEAPGGEPDFKYSGWTMPYWSDEIGQIIGESAASSDAMLLGRVTYQSFEAVFGGRTGPDADMMNNHRKYVVSNTLKSADWENSTLIQGDVIEEIVKLKQQPGGDIVISGSISLVQALLARNLIDELALIIYPVVLGMGKRLFKDGTEHFALKLVETRPTSTGVVLLRYQPVKSE